MKTLTTLITALLIPLFGQANTPLPVTGEGGTAQRGVREKGHASVLIAQSDKLATKVALDIPAGELTEALKALAKQTGTDLVYRPEQVEGLKTSGIKGEYTAMDAITQLLKGTALRLSTNTAGAMLIAEPKPIAYVTQRPTVTGEEQGMKVAQADQASFAEDSELDSQRNQETQSLDPGVAEARNAITVTGSRIRRDPSETSVSPVTVFNREDIERSGALVLADFLGRITQGANNVDRETSNFPTSGRTAINLRGLGNNTTLVLLNGHRLPKSAQGFSQDDYNLNGIPLSSVERIEVLTNSASAIYGSDAIGGVVNIITRDSYSGIDVRARYGNTTDSDVNEKSLDLTVGHAGEVFQNRRYALTLSLGFNERNRLAAIDRPYTAMTDYSDSGGSAPSSPSPFAAAGGAGSVRTMTGIFNPNPPLLPGLPSNRSAIPAGQDGRSLAPVDFLNAGPMVFASDDQPAFRSLLAPLEERSASLSSSLYLTENLHVFMAGAHFEYRSGYEGLPPSSAQIPVPADNPFNPFGVGVFVNKTFYELGPSGGEIENRNSRLATGLRGATSGDWQYELYADYTRYVGESTTVVPGDINFQPQFVETPDGGLEEVPSPGSIAIAETDPARALNVFGDGRTTEPNDIELLRSVLGDDEYRETSENWTASFQADGTLLELPSGALKMAVGGEYRREQVDFHKFNTTGTEILSLDEGAKRDVSAAFVEFSVPLIGEQQQIGAVRSLLLSLAGRLDSESVFGEEFTPKVGLMWKPVRSLALRATYGHGYKVPTLQQLFEPDITRPSFFFFPIPVDPVTGANIDYQIDIREGGNLDLMPEESTSWSAGIILEPVALPGLSVSVDYFDIDYTNRVSIVDSQAILEYFPERVQRDPDTNLPTLIDARAVNLAASRARGVDVRLVHRVSTAAHGSFDTRFNYTYNITNTLRSTPDSAEFENVDNLFLPRVRANMDLFWLRNGLEIGPTVRYEASTMNSLPFGATAPVRVANAIVVDLHASFDFDEHQSAVNSRWKNGLKLSIGVNNLFDRPPSSTNGAGGYAKVDPRQRRYYFTLQKSF